MEITLAQKAINSALQGNWEEAVATNLQILKDNPNDTDALNRLARAYAELGKLKEAREMAQKVLKIDPLNAIAQKCLDKWRNLNKVEKSLSQKVDVDAFLEESGKTKIITLLNPGDNKIFATIDPGEEVKLNAHSHSVSVVTQDDKYLGRVPDDLSAKLRSLMKLGYKYQVLVKSIEPKEVTIFIKEVEKSDGGSSSFPTEKIDYVTFTPPELVHKEQPIAIGEDLEEAEGT